MTRLITKQDVQKYKQIANSVNNDKFNQIVDEVQFEDIRPLLGDALYNDVITKLEANSTQYDLLLDGGIYTIGDITYTNYGLKAVIVHYLYAKYAMFGDVIDNPFGMTTKMNLSDSKPIDYSTKKTFYTANRNTAFQYWRSVESFLIRNNTPLFKGCEIRNNNKIRISKIG